MADSFGVSYVTIEVDKIVGPSRGAAYKALQKITGEGTFPQLFLGGKAYGGCVDFKTRTFNREFSFIAPYATKSVPVEKARINSAYSLFWFPHTIDNNNARMVAGLQAIYCVLCLAFWLNEATKWAVLALTVDFFLRFLWGGSMSVLAMISSALLANVRPVAKAGPPKQFAAFCGFVFSIWSTGLYAGGYPVGGSVILGVLLGCCLLESVLDFCV
jgi:glutaredoxin